MNPASFSLQNLAQNPDLADIFWPQKAQAWPEFMFNDSYADRYWHHLRQDFADHQLYLINEAGEPIAVAQTIPVVWDGTQAGLPIGWADGLQRGVLGHQAGQAPNTLAAIEIAISPDYQGRGISYRMVQAMRDHAKEWGYHALIAAVRPSLKHQYPLIPMESYARWQRPDGLPFDPWLRVHIKSGGQILRVAYPSMVIEGTLEQWHEWTDLTFPGSGDFLVPGALVPVQIDKEANHGRYVEPNVWVHHALGPVQLRNE